MENIKKELKNLGLKVDELEKEVEQKNKEEKRTYLVYIKSHCDLPDFDRQIEAKNIAEAVRELQKNWLTDWDTLDILEHIDCPMDNLPVEDQLILRLIDERRELQNRIIELEYELKRLKQKISSILKEVK